MNIPRYPISAVVLPRPLTPLVAFAYFLLSRATICGEVVLARHCVRWARSSAISSKPGQYDLACLGPIINLNRGYVDLQELVTQLMALDPRLDGRSIDRQVMNFFFSGAQHGDVWSRWLDYLAAISRKTEAFDVVKASNDFIASLIHGGHNFVESLPIVGEEPLPTLSIPDVTDTLVLPIPLSKRVAGDSSSERVREVINQKTLRLLEAPIFLLKGQKIVLLVGGPPGVGKSTLATSLCTQMRCIIESLQSRGGPWDSLSLRVNVATLDAATPVADTMMAAGTAQDRDAMQRKKRKWSLGLAGEAVINLEQALAETDICIADLPGKIDAITGVLAAYGTHAIVVGPSQDQAFTVAVTEWKDFFWQAGMSVVGQIKSTTSEPSIVGDYREGKCVFGRIRKPKRVVTGWDPLIQFLAQFLLFDIFPKSIHAEHLRMNRVRV